jgi:hypothetical protein
VAPIDVAIPVAISPIRRSIMSRTSRRKQRVVPRRTTVSGITFQVSPPWICVTETTAASIGRALRLTMVCRPITTCAPTTTGSIDWWGMAPWLPRPSISISKTS